jgi:acyl carrier protein
MELDSGSIEEWVMRIIGNHLGMPAFRLSLKTDISHDLGADYMDLRELVMTVEERFKIKISKDRIRNITLVEDIVDAVREQLGERADRPVKKVSRYEHRGGILEQ